MQYSGIHRLQGRISPDSYFSDDQKYHHKTSPSAYDISVPLPDGNDTAAPPAMHFSHDNKMPVFPLKSPLVTVPYSNE